VLIDWLHHLFNPHCGLCGCKNCEVLKQLLETEKYENKQLLQWILDLNKPNENVSIPLEMPIEIKPKNIPWSVRQNMLEAEDRKRAQILRDRKPIEELEKEVLDAGA